MIIIAVTLHADYAVNQYLARHFRFEDTYIFERLIHTCNITFLLVKKIKKFQFGCNN